MGPRLDSDGETAFCGNPPSTNVVSVSDSSVEALVWRQAAKPGRWKAGIDSLLPPAELRDLATEYKELDRESQAFHEFLKPYLSDCAGYLTHTADITSTAVQEQQQTLSCVITMQSRESVFGDQLSVIGKLKGYGPPLGWWQMVPYFHMAEQHDFAKEHPETNAPTVHDQQQAISVLSGSK